MGIFDNKREETNVLTYEDLIKTEKLLRKTNFRSHTVIFDEVLPKHTTREKEHTYMELFKFHTVKPTPSIIWKTLLENIETQPGEIEELTLFARYCILQLEPYFKKAKASAAVSYPIPDACKLLAVSYAQFTSLRYSFPDTYPNFVESSLRIPYYMAKQLYPLGVDVATCFRKLFDRQSLSNVETEHIIADLSAVKNDKYIGLTTWMLDNISIDYYFSHVVSIVPHTDRKIPVRDKGEITWYIVDVLNNKLKDIPDGILLPPEKVSIPEFVYTPPPSEEEVPF